MKIELATIDEVAPETPVEPQKRPAEEEEEEAPPAKARKMSPPVVEKKLIVKKAIADEIRRVKGLGGVLSDLRILAVAAALSSLGEETALGVLATLEEQQDEVEDPNEYVRTQCAAAAEDVLE